MVAVPPNDLAQRRGRGRKGKPLESNRVRCSALLGRWQLSLLWQ